MNYTGWICPKCGKVWAPHIDYCIDCISDITITSKIPDVVLTDFDKTDMYMEQGYPSQPMNAL